MSKSNSRLLFFAFSLTSIVFLGIIFITSPWWSPLAEKVHRKVKYTFAPTTPTATKVKELPSLPDRFYPKARMMTMPLTQGLDIQLNIISEQGKTASIERKNEDAYSLDTKLTYRVPQAAVTVDELEANGTPLSQLWPSLTELLSSAKVSPYYHSLYERKVTFLGMRLDHIREIPGRHNMYDCDTILELTSLNKKHRALLIQADMDIVTDGSDSDRTLDIDTSSPTFQPFTSYNWAKRSKTPNPLSADYQKEADALRANLSTGKLNQNDRYLANRRLSFLKKSVEALKYRSSLVAALDPYMVVPIFMVQTESSHQPSIGDYCLIFYKNQVLPGIVGDTGPNSKMGEASLKIAQQIDPSVDGSAQSRPVSSLGVTYLIFTGSADKEMGPPDLEHWHQNCRRGFEALGGNPDVIQSWTEAAADEDETPAEETDNR